MQIIINLSTVKGLFIKFFYFKEEEGKKRGQQRVLELPIIAQRRAGAALKREWGLLIISTGLHKAAGQIAVQWQQGVHAAARNVMNDSPLVAA